MKIFVTVKTNAKQPSVEVKDQNHFSVSVKEPARQGKATKAVIVAVARHIGVAQSRLTLLRGAKSKQKVFVVE